MARENAQVFFGLCAVLKKSRDRRDRESFAYQIFDISSIYYLEYSILDVGLHAPH